MENHYCSTCLRTTVFGATEGVVVIQDVVYQVFYCNRCMHELYVQKGQVRIAEDAT